MGKRTQQWGAEEKLRVVLEYVKLYREAGLKGSDGEPAVPETWDDLRQFAKKITERGQGKAFGIVHGIKKPEVWNQNVFMSLDALAVPGCPEDCS